jgi:Flp pilus assembly protein TadG
MRVILRTPMRRDRRSERGAALVEMAVVLPLLVLLVFGLVEFGLLFREKMTIASAATSSARTGATMGARDEADIRILQALEAGLYDQVDASVLISVDIFKANETTGVKDATNVNTYYFAPATACRWNPCPDPDDPTFAYGGSWVPSGRDTTLDPGGGGLDVLGVEIVYHHTAATNLIPGVDRDLTERALVRLEPDVFGTPTGP